MLHIDFPELNLSDFPKCDEQTSYHCKNVALISGLMGRSLGMTNPEIQDLCTAGLLHDVGMTGIPESIIMKPGPLSEEEKQFINQHPKIGARIASKAGYGDNIVNAVLSHHERLDGSGYPSGLKAGSLDRIVRIISIADVYAAAISPRPHRNELSEEQAMLELKDQDKFDQELVNVLEGVINRPHQFAVAVNQRSMQAVATQLYGAMSSLQ